MTQLVTLTIDNGIADFRLNRPAKHNALSPELQREYFKAAESLITDKSIRAVVLSGEGPSFCAGLDLSAFTSPSDEIKNFAAGSDSFPNFFQRISLIWREVPVPVICAIKGVCYGAGLQMALGTDIRIAHPESKLSLMEIKWGLIPDMGISQTLPKLIGLDQAKLLTFTGEILSGHAAKDMGLVTELSHTPYERAMELAILITSKSPEAISLGKYLWDNVTGNADHDLALEEALQIHLFTSKGFKKTVMAAMTKSEPDHDDRSFISGDEIVFILEL